jgi:hypothetical protein
MLSISGYMLLYLYTLRCFTFASTQIFLSTLTAVTLSGLGFLALSLGSGYTIHNRDLGSWCSWIQYISPLSWLMRPIIRNEFRNGTSYDNCLTNPVHMQGGIMVRILWGSCSYLSIELKGRKQGPNNIFLIYSNASTAASKMASAFYSTMT